MSSGSVLLPKDMSKEIAKEYLPRDVEQGWYQWWESNGFFRPISDVDPSATDREKFVIVIPPPNVTGYLHLGHALTSAVQDTLIRYHRMKGHDTLYVPGCDHAGISTQVVVEKRLAVETGKSRHDLGRDEFLKKVWEWKDTYGGRITQQLRLLGSSLDWSRERFTMDEQCSKAVTEAFVRFHEDGLMYRATRLVNWCCTLQSAISDLEVEYLDVTPGQFIRIPGYEKTVEVGTITSFAYKIVGSDDEIVVQTTRPETILGDTAVAVHPDDPRYKKHAGAQLQCPFRDATIPLIFDPVLVDMAFGSGAVKVTPAHDPNDFECGQRNKLPSISILNSKGHITAEGPFKNMHRYDCRRAIIKALEEKKLLREQKGHAMRLGVCSRTGDIVEPYLIPQWFVDCTSMAQRSVDAVRNGELKLIPSAHEVTWYHWLENIKPWCVSRQLWWGHRIPAYFCTIDGEPVSSDIHACWTVGRTVEEAKAKAIEKFKLSPELASKLHLRQDEDVLDTWFSSALWPFEVMGWPDTTTHDMQRFFPGNLLETGHDILFFWVARMVMTSLHFTNKLPFTEVYLHAMVRDKNGEKMSKTKGNVIDPVDVLNGISLEELQQKLHSGNLDAKEVEKCKELQKKSFPKGIPECGGDALRFGLLSYTVSGKNVNLDIDRIVGYRQFCNKLWNVIRYALYFALGQDYTPPSDVTLSPRLDDLPFECRWILSRLDKSVGECNQGFTKGRYDFALTTSSAYGFWLHEFCDVFLELTKPTMQLPKEDRRAVLTRLTLYYVIERALRALHPMMPFLTEELWHRLPNSDKFPSITIMTAPYPHPEGYQDDAVDSDMTLLLDIVHALRSLKASYQLTNKVRPDVWIIVSDPRLSGFVSAHSQSIIATLSVCGTVTQVPDRSVVPAGCGMTILSKEVTTCMMLKGYIDPKKESERLQKKLEASKKQLAGVMSKVNAEGYATKVPEDIQKANAEKIGDLTSEVQQLESAITSLKDML